LQENYENVYYLYSDRREMDDYRYIAISLVLSLFIPQVITVIGLTSSGRPISADKKCGLNEVLDGETCVCADCYKKDSDGVCVLCAESCYASTVGGTKTCSKESGVDNLQKAKDIRWSAPVSESDLFKVTNARDAPGLQIYSADHYDVNEDIPGMYPNYQNYNGVEYSTMEDVINQNYEAELNYNKVTPFLPKARGQNSGSGSYDLTRRRDLERIDRIEQQGNIPELENTLHTGLMTRGVAVDYAVQNLGKSLDHPESQLTEWSTGDVMTGYKPIDSTHRPFSQREMVQKLEERKTDRLLNGTSSVSAGPLAPDFEEKEDEVVEGRTPYPNSSIQPETSFYWQSTLPERNSLPETDMWIVGNAHVKDVPSLDPRFSEYRPNRERIIPSVKGGGFYGSVLDPLENLANSTRGFFATNIEADSGDLRGGDSEGATRSVDRVQPLERAPIAEIDVRMDRNVEPLRSTTNNAISSLTENSFRNDFITNQTVQPPTRDIERVIKRQSDVLPFYSTSQNLIDNDIYAFDRSEMVAVGPATFN
jgi:hypothetical protein